MSWPKLQMCTSVDYNADSKFFNWTLGGFNAHALHHLLPNICHVHYKQISKIVKQTAIEYNLPYYSYATFFGAIKDHTKLLKNLGKYDNAPGIHH